MAIAVIVVLSTLVALALRPEGDDDIADEMLDRRGSESADDGGAPLTIDDEPAAYRITYRVSRRGAGDRTETITVVRPFWSASVTDTSEERWAFGRVFTKDGPVFAVGPTLAGMDLRVAPALDDALDRRLLERREQRTVAGRRCQVYRASTTVVGGTLQPTIDVGEYADVCVDERGLLLEEWWVVDGDAIQQRIATEVELRVPDDFGTAWSGEPPSESAEEGGGSILTLTPGSSPPGAPFFTAPAPPGDGFEHLGRFSVIPPQAAAFGDGEERGSIVASTADVWRRGIDIVVLDQGGNLDGVAIYDPDPDNETVELPNLGTAELLVSLTGNELRVQRPGGKFVRVVGTLPLDDLLAFARTLVEGPGTEIVIDDDAPLPTP